MSEELPTVVEFDEDPMETPDIEELPAGDYPAMITAVEVRESNKTGNKYGMLTLRIDPADYPADYDPENYPDGCNLRFMRVPLENDKSSRSRLRHLAEETGLPVSARLDLTDWLHTEVRVHVEHGTWEGRVRAEARRLSRAS